MLYLVNFHTRDYLDPAKSFLRAHGIPFVVLKATFISLSLKSGKAKFYYKDEPIILNKDDFIYIRSRGKNAYHISLLAEAFLAEGIPFTDRVNVVSPEGSSKMTQTIRFSFNNLPIPSSFIFHKKNIAHVPSILKQEGLTYPIVLKRTGIKGRGVFLIVNETELRNQVGEIEDTEEFLIQEKIEARGDLRVQLVGNKVLYGLLRISKEGFLHNTSQGAEESSFEVTKEMEDVAQKAASIAQLDIAGVDLLLTKENHFFLTEANKTPGFDPIRTAEVLTALLQNRKEFSGFFRSLDM